MGLAVSVNIGSLLAVVDRSGSIVLVSCKNISWHVSSFFVCIVYFEFQFVQC